MNLSNEGRLGFSLLVCLFSVCMMVVMAIASVFYDPKKAAEEEAKRVQAYNGRAEADVSKCLKEHTPWQCLQKMSDAEYYDHAASDSTKTRVARIVDGTPAKAMFAFCRDAGEAKCGETMVSYGYPSSEVLPALNSSN